ncbi:MAG: hypothetical protein HY263_04475 [Chloroflexi bacterium]|nr:hypothetical protein [Chloroflexota bacterium]
MSLAGGADDGPPGDPEPANPAAGDPPKREHVAYGSIIDRFRGTQWDTSPDLPPPPPRNAVSPMAIGLGVVALVAVAAFGLIALLGRPEAAAPSPSRFIATPQPTPGPDDLLLTAFWRQVDGPTFNYHLELKATVTEATFKVNETASLDVYADDFTGPALISLTGAAKPTQVVLLNSGGVLYLKPKGASHWENALTSSQLEFNMRPFLNLEDQRQLIVSGTVIRGGVTYQRLVSTPVYRAPMARVMPIGIGSLPPGTTSLVLLVTDAGVPVEATIIAHVPADPANGTPAIDGTATYTFSKVGEINPILPPKL